MHEKLSKSVDVQRSYNRLKVRRFYEAQENATYLNISVSRRSAATHFKCDVLCYNSFVVNLTGFPTVKEFRKID